MSWFLLHDTVFKASFQVVYDRQVISKVSPFLSTLVSDLLIANPRRRPTAEQMLLKLHEEKNKIAGNWKLQYQSIKLGFVN